MFEIARILVCLLLFNILQQNLELDGDEGFNTGYYHIQVMQRIKTGNKSLHNLQNSANIDRHNKKFHSLSCRVFDLLDKFQFAWFPWNSWLC